ncbi:MAG: 5-deoxy-glucuronate isomerase [Pseudomonadota bacterium]
MTQHFHSIAGESGLNELQDHSCELLGFSRLLLAKGCTHRGTVSAYREMLLVALAGKARITVNGVVFGDVGGRVNVFAQSPHSVYLPRGAEFTVEALSAFDAALPSAPSSLDIAPYEIRPEQVRTGSWGTLNYTRHFREILVEPDGRPAASLIVGETLTPSGNWSTYPPHKHEGGEGGEAFHEEMYYFRVSTPEGFGFLRHYGEQDGGFDNTHIVRDNTLVSLPHGYHTYAGAPGSQSYYLWFLAGDGRRQGAKVDPSLAWTQKLVGMV